MILFRDMRRVKVLLVLTAVVIAAASLWVSNVLVRDLMQQERQNMEVWAEAMRALQRADDTTDLSLVLSVVNGNNTIPVVVRGADGGLLAARNVGLPPDSLQAMIAMPRTDAQRAFLASLTERAERMKADGHYMRLNLEADSTGSKDDSFIDISYEPSLMLQRLQQYPYVQLGVVALFIVVALLALLSSKRAEQNKVWVGLSRETAHQLGTPLSSLMAGIEILKDGYPEDELLPEMDKDIRRLQLIAERFSKIGAAPVLKDENLCEVIFRATEYVGRRASDKVSLTTNFPSDNVPVSLNAPLFEWVIENLCKNAIDAMQGVGSITIYVYSSGKHVAVEVSDTGKGITRKDWNNVFRPGFTTKKRGWGLGLSLAKRIVEEYHKGKIFIKDSQQGKGTTFCILLPKGS